MIEVRVDLPDHTQLPSETWASSSASRTGKTAAASPSPPPAACRTNAAISPAADPKPTLRTSARPRRHPDHCNDRRPGAALSRHQPAVAAWALILRRHRRQRCGSPWPAASPQSCHRVTLPTGIIHSRLSRVTDQRKPQRSLLTRPSSSRRRKSVRRTRFYLFRERRGRWGVSPCLSSTHASAIRAGTLLTSRALPPSSRCRLQADRTAASSTRSWIGSKRGSRPGRSAGPATQPEPGQVM